MPDEDEKTTKLVQLNLALAGHGEMNDQIELPANRGDQLIGQGFAFEVIPELEPEPEDSLEVSDETQGGAHAADDDSDDSVPEPEDDEPAVPLKGQVSQ